MADAEFVEDIGVVHRDVADDDIGLEEIDEGRACNIFVNGDPLPGNTFEELSRFMATRVAAGADELQSRKLFKREATIDLATEFHEQGVARIRPHR